MNEEEFLCPKCPESVNESQKYCPKCGASLNWNKAERSSSKKTRTWAWNIGIAVVFILAGAFSYLHGRYPDNSLLHPFGQKSEQVDTQWIPSGYTSYSDTIAYNFPTKQDCSPLFVYCFQYEFVSKNTCPNGFYAALNWKDKSGSILNYTNASLPSLQAGQVAKLTFNFTEAANSSFGGLDIARIRCY